MFVLFLFRQEKYPKERGQRGAPLCNPPRLSRVPAIQRRRRKPAYSGTPAPTAVPWSGIAAWQGPPGAPSLVRYGKLPVGADLRAKCRRKRRLRSERRPAGRTVLIGPTFHSAALRVTSLYGERSDANAPGLALRGLLPIRGNQNPPLWRVFGYFLRSRWRLRRLTDAAYPLRVLYEQKGTLPFAASRPLILTLLLCVTPQRFWITLGLGA